MTAKIIIDPSGTVRFIYDDELRQMMRLGEAVITRASSVEPTASGEWTADMAPSGGPVLGPFVTRAAALEAEHVWINENVLV